MALRQAMILIAFIHGVFSAYAATPKLLLDFQFNEGQGITSASSVGSTVLTLGKGFDVSNDPVGSTDSPSGMTGDLAGEFNGIGWCSGTFDGEPLDLTKPVTWEAWVNIDAERVGDYEDYFRLANTFKIGADTNHCFEVTLLGVEDIRSKVIQMTAGGGWTHVAAVWKPGVGVTFFQDGYEMDSVESTNLPKDYQSQSKVLTIGSDNRGGCLFKGKLDRMRVYNRALANYELDSNPANPMPIGDAVFAWDFDNEVLPFEGKGQNPVSLTAGRIQIAWSASAPARDVDPFADDFSVYIDNRGTGDYAYKYATFDCDTIDFGDTSDASFTLEAWFKGLSKSELKQVFFQTWSSTTGKCPRLSFAIASDFTVYLTTMGVYDIYTGAAIPEDGGWHHIACTFDQPNKKLLTYVDGKLASDQARNWDADGEPIGSFDVRFDTQDSDSNMGTIGAEHAAYAPFTGYVDRLRFWKGVLSQSQLDYNKLVITKPTITTQPKSQTVNEGSSVTFSVVATGTIPLKYQWKKNGSNISGATGSSYTISSAKSSDAGSYTVTVSNSAGSVTSTAATLAVNIKPTITTQSKSQTVNEGSSVTFSVVAIGTAPLKYQWKKNGSDISGATSASYTISSAKSSDAGNYTVTVSNSAGSVTSSAVTLTVNVPVILSSITISGNSSVNVGSTATYTCTATYSNGASKTVTPTWAISAGTSYASISSTGVLTGKAAGAATIQAKYTDGGVTKTATKNVTVNAVVVKPSITTQPKSQTVNEGNSVTFSVVATGTAPLTYQWKKNGSNISGATGSSYTISSAKSSDAGSYTVTVSNSAGSVTSIVANLTVNPVLTLSSIKIFANGNSLDVGKTMSLLCKAYYNNGTSKTVTPIWTISSGIDCASITSEGILTGESSGTVEVKASYTEEGITETSTVTVTITGKEVEKPTITTQPKSQTVDEGSSVTFSVTATGTDLNYQWKKDGSNISGATGSSYTINSVKTSDAGSYTVTVSNSAGSVTCNAATLTINGTTPIEPNGTATRSVNRGGKSATVTLKLEPDANVSVMFVEERVPAGVTISVNNGGTYVASQNMIRWSFLDGNPRDISYVLIVADNFSGKVSLDGEVTFDETTVAITGTSEIDFANSTHPADMNNNWEISTKEVSSYALAWTKGQSWSREPADIPVLYVSRAALIWINGGYYDYDLGKSEPSCWVSTNVKPSSVELASASVNVRTINVLEGKANVSVEVIPADGVSVYFVEEQLPAGMNQNVTNISDGGKYVEGRGLIRWSFLDAEPRTLTYTLEPEAGFSGVIELNGEVTFDEETFVTEGDTEANFGGGADVPVITAAYFGGMLIEGTIGGTYVIEYSEDGVNWTKADEITLTTSSMYWADLTSANSPKRLYRAKVK